MINGDVENISTEDSDIEVKGKVGTITSHNGNVTCSDVEGDRNNGVMGFVTATDLFKIKFADGTPFGVKVEE